MAFVITKKIALAGMVAMCALMAGCASTRINFNGPPDTVMAVDGKRYVLPAQIEMSRPSGSGGSTRHSVSLVATVNSKELRAKGHIDVFGYEEIDADRYAVNHCDLNEDQLAKIFDGNVLRFVGNSASRQPLYEMMLGKE